MASKAAFASSMLPQRVTPSEPALSSGFTTTLKGLGLHSARYASASAQLCT